MSDNNTSSPSLGFTAQIVSAHVAHNSIQAGDLPGLIQQVYKALDMLGSAPVQATDRLEPAVPVKKSVFPDYIVCLEDGKKLKMLKRHLMTSYSLTPEDYRKRWGLPSSYPMVAPSYADRRSALAKSIGLGRKPAGAVEGLGTVEAVAAPEEPEVTPIPKTRGRKQAKAA